MDFDTTDLKTTRKNLNALSLLIVFYFGSGATLGTDNGTISLLGNSLLIEKDNLYMIWFLVISTQAYLMWRFVTLFRRQEFGVGDYLLQSPSVQSLIGQAVGLRPMTAYSIKFEKPGLIYYRHLGTWSKKWPILEDTTSLVVVTSRGLKLTDRDRALRGIPDRNVYIIFTGPSVSIPVGFKHSEGTPEYIKTPLTDWLNSKPSLFRLSSSGTLTLQSMLHELGLPKPPLGTSHRESNWENFSGIYIGLENLTPFRALDLESDYFTDRFLPLALPLVAFTMLTVSGAEALAFQFQHSLLW